MFDMNVLQFLQILKARLKILFFLLALLGELLWTVCVGKKCYHLLISLQAPHIRLSEKGT